MKFKIFLKLTFSYSPKMTYSKLKSVKNYIERLSNKHHKSYVTYYHESCLIYYDIVRNESSHISYYSTVSNSPKEIYYCTACSQLITYIFSCLSFFFLFFLFLLLLLLHFFVLFACLLVNCSYHFKFGLIFQHCCSGLFPSQHTCKVDM